MLGKRIKQLIKSKGYNQEEFANIIGVSRSTLLGQIDRPSFSTMEKIASALGVPTWQLFVDPEDVYNEVSPKEPDFTALIKDGNEQYSASSLDELEELVKKLRSKRIGIKLEKEEG